MVLVFFGAITGLVVPKSAWAQTELERAGARDAASQGLEAYNKKDYVQALDLFQRAETVLHAPTHLLYMARSAVGLGQFVRAREIYMRLKREQLPAQSPAAFVDAQKSGISELAELEPRIPRLKIVLNGAAASSVTFDGQPMSVALVGVFVPVDPGQHHVVVHGATGENVEQHVELKESAKETVTLTLAANTSPASAQKTASTPPTVSTSPTATPTSPVSSKTETNSTLRWVSYASFGVGVIGLGSGTYFLLRSGSKADDADALYEKKRCPAATCTASDKQNITNLDDDAASAKTIGVTGLIVGGIGVAAGVTLFVLSSKQTESKHAWVLPYASSNEVGVVGRF